MKIIHVRIEKNNFIKSLNILKGPIKELILLGRKTLPKDSQAIK